VCENEDDDDFEPQMPVRSLQKGSFEPQIRNHEMTSRLTSFSLPCDFREMKFSGEKATTGFDYSVCVIVEVEEVEGRREMAMMRGICRHLI
jgi:hypothetical protein